MKIVIKGYYGWGNLGDDLLLLTSVHIAKNLFPNSEIIIWTESTQNDYIVKLCGPLTIANSSTQLKVDLIIHGGGGVYFDFKKGGLKYQLLNFFIRLCGYSLYRKIFKGIKLLEQKPGIRGGIRVGLGIGIGKFTSSSKKFYSSILSLSDYAILFVRDSGSLEKCKEYEFKYPVYKSTDIAFYSDAWLPRLGKIARNNSKVGFILRDWIYDNHLHIDNAIQAVKKLRLRGIEVEFYSFDPREDQYFIRSVKNDFSIYLWDPLNTELAEILEHLSTNSCIVSSRAHGAIVAACLDIPSICLEIEPKLKSIVEMLPESSLLIEPPFNIDFIEAQVVNRILNPEHYYSAAKRDVDNNKQLLFKDLEKFKSFVSAKL